MSLLAGAYVLLIVLLVGADVASITPSSLLAASRTPEIQYAFALSMISSTIATILSLWFAVPAGYLLSRYSHSTDAAGVSQRRSLFGRAVISFVDAVLDIPLVLPPLVVGISLLVLFQFAPFSWISNWVVYEIPAVILAQFTVACAFAVRAMRITFDQIPVRQEQVAMTLGASRGQAFWQVLLPQARRGMLAAATLCWARSLGEFGPVLVFASSTRMRTEVLPTTVYLEIQSGNLAAALAVSVFLVLVAVIVLVVTRLIGWQRFE
jgi:molybdate transport system permease protein